MPVSINAIKNWFASRLERVKSGRVRRRRAISVFIGRWLQHIRALLFLTGYLWLLLLPSPRLGRGTYIDENALQPSQVNTFWNWGEVHKADLYLAQLELLRDNNASSQIRAESLKFEFEKLGLHASTQPYHFNTGTNKLTGVNAYSILSSPRASGTEAMVISSSWISRSGSLNLRGVATVLALASFLKQYSLWAKDVIFVIGDGHLDGMQAWLSAYHGTVQTNLETEPLSLSSGVIWTALNIDYPGHSFSHLGIFHEGLNGRLPNQDLINSFNLISRRTGGVPVSLYDHLDPRDSDDKSHPPQWLQRAVAYSSEFYEYVIRARSVARHLYSQALGEATGVHGLYHRYRIDAITLFAVPATGPHGFHSIGKVIESTLRTMNNLLERLHASFFFYILTTPETFLKIGHYLPSVILISVAMMFGGLWEWIDAGWMLIEVHVDDKKDRQTPLVKRPRPVLEALLIMSGTHVLGSIFFLILWSEWVPQVAKALIGGPWSWFLLIFPLPASWLAFGLLQGVTQRLTITKDGSLATVLKSLNLCLASTLISVTCVLNFSFAALLAVLLGIPLSLSVCAGTRTSKIISCAAYLAYTLLILQTFITEHALWNWTILGVWFAPLMCSVYIPLLLQAAVVSIWPS